jgi:hypothetical protein
VARCVPLPRRRAALRRTACSAHLYICIQWLTMSRHMSHSQTCGATPPPTPTPAPAPPAPASTASSPAVAARSVTMSSSAPNAVVCFSARAAGPSTASSKYDSAYSDANRSAPDALPSSEAKAASAANTRT